MFETLGTFETFERFDTCETSEAFETFEMFETFGTVEAFEAFDSAASPCLCSQAKAVTHSDKNCCPVHPALDCTWTLVLAKVLLRLAQFTDQVSVRQHSCVYRSS